MIDRERAYGGKKRNNGKDFALIIAGTALLANPCVNVLDVLPDFVGMLLILRGITKMGATDTHAGEARSLMKKAMWVSLGKLFVMILSITSKLFDSYMLLVFTLSGGILDCVFFIPAMRALTNGAEYTRLNITGISDEKKADELNVFTAVFFVANGILTMAPLTPYLFVDESGMIKAGDKKYIDPAAIVPIITAVTAALALILGIIWLVSVCKYFVPMKRDEALCDGIDGRYAETVLSNKYIMRKKHVSAFFSVLLPSTFLLLCIRADVYYVSFAWLFGTAALISSAVVGDLIENRKKLIWLSSAGAAVGIASFAFMRNYSNRFGGMIFVYAEKDFPAAFLPFIAAETLAMAILSLVFKEIMNIQRATCEKCVGRDDDTPRRAEISEAIKKEITKKIKTTYIIGVIYCITAVLCYAAIPFESVSDVFALSWALRSAVGAGYVISTFSVAARLKEEAEK